MTFAQSIERQHHANQYVVICLDLIFTSHHPILGYGTIGFPRQRHLNNSKSNLTYREVNLKIMQNEGIRSEISHTRGYFPWRHILGSYAIHKTVDSLKSWEWHQIYIFNGLAGPRRQHWDLHGLLLCADLRPLIKSVWSWWFDILKNRMSCRSQIWRAKELTE